MQESLASMESSGSTVAASVNDPRPPSVTSTEVTEQSQHEVTKLKPHSLYHLHVCLRNGRELIAKDSSGTSDPYVKFYWRGKQVYKSKTIDKDLNPVWDESFILAIDDPFMPMEIKVSRGKKEFFLYENMTEIRGLRSTQCSRETLQYFPYFCNKKTNVVFHFVQPK